MITSRYYFDRLNESEKVLYKRIYESMMKNHNSMEEIEASCGRIRWVYDCVLWDNPFIITFTENDFINIWDEQIKVLRLGAISKEHHEKEKRAEIEGVINSILSLDGLLEMEEFQREVFVHDFICNNVAVIDKPKSIDDNNVYGAIINRRATILGITKTVKLLLNTLNIKCIVVSGLKSDKAHYWNIVQIDRWNYNLDTVEDCRLVSQNGRYMRYDYFNFRAEDLPDYEPTNKDVLPECIAIYNNYVVRAGGYVSNNERAKTYILNSLKKRKKSIYFKNNKNVEDTFSELGFDTFAEKIRILIESILVEHNDIRYRLEKNTQVEIINVDFTYD